RRMLLLAFEVDAGHDVDAARGDPEIDRDVPAELERGFDQLDAIGADPEREEAAAAEDRDREQERLLAFGEMETRAHGIAGERYRQGRPEADVLEAENADPDRRQLERIAGGHALGRHVERRRVAETVVRDDRAQLVDEFERAIEDHAAGDRRAGKLLVFLVEG